MSKPIAIKLGSYHNVMFLWQRPVIISCLKNENLNSGVVKYGTNPKKQRKSNFLEVSLDYTRNSSIFQSTYKTLYQKKEIQIYI